MRVEFAGDDGEFLRLVERVVDILDKDEFERQHAPVLAGEGLGRRDELLEGELLVHRHDLVADLVGRAVEADGEAEAQWLLGELEDLGDDAGGRDRDPAGPEAETPGGVDDA